MAWSNGKVTQAKVKSSAEQTVILRCNGEVKAVALPLEKWASVI
jgi:hypothetical protein